MRGLLVNEETFEERLAYDEIFAEYFNEFLSLPAFSKVVQYDNLAGAFHDVTQDSGSTVPLQPSDDAENESRKKEKVMQWVKKERLPLFLKTSIYREFKLCRLLLRNLRDSRSTARGSSRGLRGYSRATGSSPVSSIAERPSSHTSNKSWPGVPVRNYGRRPLGSAASLPGMLQLGIGLDKEGGVTNEMVQTNGLDETFPVNQDITSEKPQEIPTDVENGELNEKLKANESLMETSDKQETKVAASDNKEEATEKADESTEQKNGDDVTGHVSDDAGDSEGEGAADDDLSAIMEFVDEGDLDEADVRSIASRHNVTLEELKHQTLGSLRGMGLFHSFLEDTSGIYLHNFWLDAEQYKDSLQSEPEDKVRELRTRLFREIQDKYKNCLTVDARDQIERALYNGGVTQDLFTRTQYDMLRRMRSYWIPRFLVHLERNEEFGDSYFTYVSPRDRPGSSLSFFPTLSLVHSLPPLGDWCREIIRSRKWDRDILIKDKRSKSAKKRLTAIPEDASADPFRSALKAEKDAGCPFKRYLHGKKELRLLANLSFWLDVSDYHEAERRSGDRYLSRCAAWNIYNTYMAPGARMDIKLQDPERMRVEKSLHSSEELPLDLFKPSEENAVEALRLAWEDYKDYDKQRYRKPPRNASDRSFSVASGKDGHIPKDHYYSPTTGRWIKRHPGSSPSERGRRLYTSLAMAEEIDADRSISASSPKQRPPLIPSPIRGKKGQKGAKINKKKTKGSKNVTFDSKKKGGLDSDDDEEDSMESKQGKPAQPVVPEFVDVVENKSTMSAFKQYVQNMEGRQAMNQLMMYLEIEQYYVIMPAKKMQKTQQATHIHKTYFDSASRRCVPLPSLLVAGIDGDRPSSPVMAEAQQAVIADIKSYFKTFFKQAQDTGQVKRDGTFTPNTPGLFSKADTFESSQSFLQFYKKKSKKTKSTGRIPPSKEDKEDFRRTLQSTHGRLPVKLEYFRRYLQSHGDPENFTKLENDFHFYLEVQKFKDLFNFMDEASMNKKVETIIECFLDSATPPWLQIDIGPELASRIIHKAQVFLSSKRVPKEQKDPSLFDEAQSILFKELLPFWAGFCKQYTEPRSDDQGAVRLPPTKQEKTLNKRYQEFVKYQSVTDTLVLPPVVPIYGQSKTEVTFSVSDGMRWKDRKEIDTISVASSVAESVSGGVTKGSTMDGSVQPIEVGS